MYLYREMTGLYYFWNSAQEMKGTSADASSLDQEHEDEKHIVLLPGGAQDIVNEFALRYSIEPIYRLMW